MCKNFLGSSDGGVIFFESESAVTKDIIEERDIDSSRMVIMVITTVQEFRHQAITVLDKCMRLVRLKENHYCCFRFFRYVVNY